MSAADRASMIFRFVLVLIVAGILLGHYWLHQLSVPAEAALRLSEAGMMLDGAVPYVDFFDNASPFYIYLNLLPAGLSQLTFLHPIFILNALNVGFFALSAGALILLGRSGKGRPLWRNPFAPCQSACLLGFFLVVLCQPVQFAQANQLLFLAMTPYIVCRALRLKGMRVARSLALAIGLALGFVILLDPLFVVFFLLFEVSIIFGLYPYTGYSFLKKRYLGLELKAALILALSLGSMFALIPSLSARHYILDILPINLDGYLEVMNALCYAGNSSDMRPEMFAGALCVMAAAPFAGRNLVTRLFAVATLLSLALLIGQTGILSYQAYPLLSFGVITLASVFNPALLPQALRKTTAPLVKFAAWQSKISTAAVVLASLKPRLLGALLGVALVGSAALTYIFERATLGADNLYRLDRLGYYGVADKRDIGVLGEVVEMYSKPRQAVVVLGLGLRPGFPLLTQLRRKPGLALTWGFPLDILHIMEAPVYGKQMAAAKDFSDTIYRDMIRRFTLTEGAPVLVLIDEGEVRTLLDEHGVAAFLDANYVGKGGASLLDSSSTSGHPPLEYVGYKSGFGIYRHK
jgi:hypothetical protein